MPLYCLFYLSPFLLLFVDPGFPHLVLLHAPPDSPTKSKSQLPNAYSIFPRGSDLGIMRRKSWRRGGEMQLCWSPCSRRGSFLAAFGGLLSWGSGGSERRFEVAGTRLVPYDVPRGWCTRYLRKSTCSTPCLLIASRMRLIRCYCCCEQRNLILAACMCTVCCWCCIGSSPPEAAVPNTRRVRALPAASSPGKSPR